MQQDNGRCLIVLDRTPQTIAHGIYNLWLANGEWTQLSGEVLNRGPHHIARAVTNSSPGFAPKTGDRAAWSGIYFASPTDAGLNARKVRVHPTEHNPPAWLIEGAQGTQGDSATWVIHIHGLASTPAGTLRGVQVTSKMGYPSLVISHQNGTKSPTGGSERSSLGVMEIHDGHAALTYAIRHGAQQIILFGWSMGAAIALQLAHHHQDLVAGMVLESPVLDWVEVIKTNCARHHLPTHAGLLAIPWLTLRPLSRMIGLPTTIPLREFDWIARATDLTAPTLIIHGKADDSAPIRLSQKLRTLRPDLVELKTFNASHTQSWNTDPARWQSTITQWITTHIKPGNRRNLGGERCAETPRQGRDEQPSEYW